MVPKYCGNEANPDVDQETGQWQPSMILISTRSAAQEQLGQEVPGEQAEEGADHKTLLPEVSKSSPLKRLTDNSFLERSQKLWKTNW